MRLSFILVLLLILISWAFAAADHIRMGDHLMSRGDYLEALEEYRQAESENPDDPQVLWRLGSALTRVALNGPGCFRHQRLEEATNYINNALTADRNILEAHLEYARALGYLALFMPDWDDFRVARRVREELDMVLNEEPDNADAHILMGLWHLWVSPMPLLKRKPQSLGSADLDSATYYMRRAVKLDNDNLEYQFQLGMAYLVCGSGAAGRQILEDLAAMEKVPIRYANIPERAQEALDGFEDE